MVSEANSNSNSRSDNKNKKNKNSDNDNDNNKHVLLPAVTTPPKVIIIGAGAAGLQCSRCLREAGIEVIVLEARNRIGGRVCSVEHNVANQTIVVDEGAAWVHGIGYDWPSDEAAMEEPRSEEVNPMMDLLLESTGGYRKTLFQDKLRPFFLRGNPWMRPSHCLWKDRQLALFLDGQRVEDAKLVKCSLDRHFDVIDEVALVGQRLARSGRYQTVCLQQSLRESLQRVLKKKWIKQQQKQFSDEQFSRIEALREFYVHLIEVWYGGEAEQLQMSEFMNHDDDNDLDQDIGFSGEGDYYGPHATVNGGLSALIKPLIGHGEEIRLNEVVTKLNDAHDHVTIQTSSGLVLEADTVVVTIPLGALNDGCSKGLFHPQLSEPKLEALSKLRMGTYKKVMLEFDSIFWPQDEAFLGLVWRDSTSPLGPHLVVDNLWKGLPCFEVVLTGHSCLWANDRPDREIRDAVLQFLEYTMDESDLAQRCVKCHITRWEEDPFSRGAYSTYGIGAEMTHSLALQQSEWCDKLYLAGEHTIAEFEGSVHAALLSGRNTAAAVRKALARTKYK